MKTTTLKEFQDKFNAILKSVPNQKILIENELKEIDIYIRNERTSKPPGSSFFSPAPMQFSNGTHIFKIQIIQFHRCLFSESFNNYLYYGQETDTSSIENLHKKETIKQAYEFVEYYKWLKELESNQTKKTTQRKSSLTHKQKMLGLHYLGLDLSKYDNTDSAKILSQILELDYDNTRKYLSYVSAGKNDVRNKRNLETVLKLFENHGFNDISNTIDKDIEKL